MIQAILQKRQEIAENTVECQFQLSQPSSFLPSGYCKFIVPKLIKGDPKGNCRKFSFVNSPTHSMSVTIAFRVTNSGFKQTLLQQPIGSLDEIDKIKSKLLLPHDLKTTLVFIAGGIGVTPFISILRYVSEKSLWYKIHMFYFNRGENSAAKK